MEYVWHMARGTRSVVIVNYMYPRLLRRVSVPRGYKSVSFDNFSQEIRSIDFGIDQATADALRNRGWSPSVFVANSVLGWSAWLSEQGDVGFRRSLIPRMLLGLHKLFGRQALDRRAWGFFVTLAADVLRPDVLYFGHPAVLTERQALSLKKKGVLLVLNHSASVPDERILRQCDGFVSCVRWLTDYAMSRGVKALHLRLGFKDHDALARDGSGARRARDIEVSFVGTVSAKQHASTVPLLEAIAHRVDGLRIYGPPSKLITENETLGPRYQGEAWGREMTEVLERSKVTVNRHGTAPGGEAANMRLYEATGAGAALVTDQRKFIEEILTPGIEVVLYDSPEEAAEKIRHLLSDDQLREEIARAGREKTLSSHTIVQRAQTLDTFLLQLIHRAKTK